MPELTLSEFHSSELPLSEMIVGRMDYIHELFLNFEYEVVDDLPRDRTDLVAIIDNAERRSKLEQLSCHRGRVVLVAAGSDFPFGTDILPPGSVLPSNFAAVFAVNNDNRDPRIVNLPLGVRLESAGACRAAICAGDGSRDGLLYGNFTLKPAVYRPGVDGEPHIRHRLARRFETAAWATTDIAEDYRSGEERLAAYYAELARHKFVLSPEGLGADCYRHWECLHLGAIPIVRAGPEMAAFSDLPILFTEDYSEIDPPYLEDQWERLKARRFEFKRLLASFYRERFLDSVANLSRPRFLCWGFQGAKAEKFLDLLRHAGARTLT